MDFLEESKKINGKKVTCVIIFDKYSESKYKKDFQEFVMLQTKGYLPEENPNKPTTRIFHLQDYPFVNYQDFRAWSIKLFSQVIFELIKQQPEFLLSSELTIQLKVIRVPNWGYFFETIDEAFNEENAAYETAGIWIIQNLVAPWFYFRRVDFSTIIRIFRHEFAHYIDFAQKRLSWDVGKNYQKTKIKPLARRKSAYCLNYLYNTLFNLREEGYADFIQRLESPKQDLSMKGVTEYNQNLKRLARMRLKKESEPFYENKISTGNLTPSGEYSVGRTMCLTIAMAAAKKGKMPYRIKAGGKEYFGYEYRELDSMIGKNDFITVENIPRAALVQAQKLVSPTNHYYFLKLYENACKALGISEKNQAMTQRRFFALVKEAAKHAEEEKKRKMKSAGVVYIPPEEEQGNLPAKTA